MPELPEVETIARTLRPRVAGRTIRTVRLGKTDFMDDPAQLEAALGGARILSVARHGKFLAFELDSPGCPGNPVHWMVHLGMTGRMTIRAEEESPAAHTHLICTFTEGNALHYTDPRRFGRMRILPPGALPEFLSRLGAEPLEISPGEFHQLLQARRARIKAVLLDQRRLRGIGNIYADEALWRARIHPCRIAASLDRRKSVALLRALRRILRRAIGMGGSSISDYVDASERPGRFQRVHRVYGREGQPCARCGTQIRRIQVAGRSSHVCQRCQRPPWRSARGGI